MIKKIQISFSELLKCLSRQCKMFKDFTLDNFKCSLCGSDNLLGKNKLQMRKRN